MKPKAKLLNRKFDRLLVVAFEGTSKHNHTIWKCLCDCGNVSIVDAGNLLQGKTTSCGCFQIERVKEANTTHGLSKTKVYRAWRDMLTRCYNPNREKYKDYGGRGIIVCEKWKKFEFFYEDIGLPPNNIMSLGRIDNNGNYEPSNCEWQSAKEQRENTRPRKIKCPECSHEFYFDRKLRNS